MFKKLIIAALGAGLVVAALVYAKLEQFTAMGEAAANMVVPAQTVTAMTVSPTQWEQVIVAPATVTAVQGVTVSAEVGGRVTAIAFESGAAVNAGDILLQLDTSSEQAQLAAADATEALAQADLARVRKLGQRDLASDDTVDRAEALVKETVAQVGVIRAQIAKNTVRAPFSGQLGLRLVNLGQILSDGDPIVTLQTLDPVYLDFSVPQQQLSQLAAGMLVRVSADAAPDALFEGRVIAINPEIDAATRNVRVRARVQNPDHQLRAGMFANVEVVLPQQLDTLPVAASAILYAPFGDSVFVIDEKADEADGSNKLVLRQQFVRVGMARGDFVDVLDGLEPGDRVVTSGVFKLRAGIEVVIDNTLAPKPELKPRPNNS
jgi:membrane fusion protein (multidrug efflux system)